MVELACLWAEHTHHGPVQLLQIGFAVECKVETRDEGAHNLDDNGHIVEANPEVGKGPRVAYQRVVGGRRAKANDAGGQEDAEHEFVLP